MVDPNACLEELLSAIDNYRLAADNGDRETVDYCAARMADHVETLDGWLKCGGALPSAWTLTGGR